MELMIKNGTYVKLVRDSYPPASDYIHFPRSRFYALLGANLEERYEKYPNYLDFVYKVIGSSAYDRTDTVYHIVSEEGCHILIDSKGLKKMSILEMIIKKK